MTESKHSSLNRMLHIFLVRQMQGLENDASEINFVDLSQENYVVENVLSYLGASRDILSVSS